MDSVLRNANSLRVDDKKAHIIIHYSYRFDKLLYLGVNEDHEQQLKVIKALTRK